MATQNHAAITVSGLVQGVGYRWFANRHAQAMGLSGYVKNNYDDTVSIEVEGERSVIEAFIAELKTGPRSAQVRDVRVEWSDPKHLFTGFRIR
ncbi:MAG TPA: acylphosphatase [Bacteroidota bacterium]|nr:acylphosphatase [Bacteroidota bacterium]